MSYGPKFKPGQTLENISAKDLQHLHDTAKDYHQHLTANPPLRLTKMQGGGGMTLSWDGTGTVWGQITEVATVNDQNAYAWQQVSPQPDGTFKTTPDGYYGQLAEDDQGNFYTYNCAFEINNIEVANGTVVRLRRGYQHVPDDSDNVFGTEWLFQSSGPIMGWVQTYGESVGPDYIFLAGTQLTVKFVEGENTATVESGDVTSNDVGRVILAPGYLLETPFYTTITGLAGDTITLSEAAIASGTVTAYVAGLTIEGYPAYRMTWDGDFLFPGGNPWAPVIVVDNEEVTLPPNCWLISPNWPNPTDDDAGGFPGYDPTETSPDPNDSDVPAPHNQMPLPNMTAPLLCLQVGTDIYQVPVFAWANDPALEYDYGSPNGPNPGEPVTILGAKKNTLVSGGYPVTQSSQITLGNGTLTLGFINDDGTAQGGLIYVVPNGTGVSFYQADSGADTAGSQFINGVCVSVGANNSGGGGDYGTF